MDFSFTENQATVRDLARGILDKEVTPDRVKEVEGAPEWFDRPLWATLAQAGLLGLAVDEERGGMGFGLPELAVLLGELGRVVAPVPALATLAYAGLPIAIYATDDQKARWLPAIAAGELVLSAGPTGLGHGGASSNAQAESEGGAWVLTGRQTEVPSANVAAGVLLSARVGDGAGLFMVDPTAPGVKVTGGATSTGEPLFTLDLEGVVVEAADVLGGQPVSGDAATRMLEHVRQLAVVATCAAQVGVSEKALEITAGYVSEREQFGAPIGSFQAVQHRAANAYMDLEAMRWTTWRAINCLDEGGDATLDVSIAKFWCADGGSRIANSCQHLHGGMGVDVDYPIHRYFLWSKNLELRFGAATPTLVRMGRQMAARFPDAAGAEVN